MVIRLGLLVALLTLSLGAPLAAQEPAAPAATENFAPIATPVDAVQGFVAAVMSSNYALAWHALTGRSKAYIVSGVATDEKMDETVVRPLFDATDPRVVRGFWTSFHRSFAKFGAASQGRAARLVSGDDASAVVEYGGIPWKCFYEDGGWHVGYAESFLIKPSTK